MKMSEKSQKSYEANILDRFPDLRKAALESGDFILWRDGLPSIDIDGENLFIRGGDMLKDEDQIIFEWVRKQGWLPEELINQGS
jgi:hypothetical protein